MSSASESSDFRVTFPEDVRDYVSEIYGKSEGIVEYGSGGSTVMAAELGKRCVSVESDAAWSARLNAHLLDRFGKDCPTRVVHVDIGPTGKWGTPKGSAAAKRFWTYPMSVWDGEGALGIDTVLIDGRFRKACFAATLLNIRQTTRILFDDYRDRRHYHQVQFFSKPTRVIGRMAEFIAEPGQVRPEDFRRIIPWFMQKR